MDFWGTTLYPLPAAPLSPSLESIVKREQSCSPYEGGRWSWIKKFRGLQIESAKAWYLWIAMKKAKAKDQLLWWTRYTFASCSIMYNMCNSFFRSRYTQQVLNLSINELHQSLITLLLFIFRAICNLSLKNQFDLHLLSSSFYKFHTMIDSSDVHFKTTSLFDGWFDLIIRKF